MEYTAKQLSELLNGTIEGNTEAIVTKLSKIEEAENGSLSFLANPKYFSHLYTTSASIVIIGKDFEPEKDFTPTLIRVEDAYKSFASLTEIYDEIKSHKLGIDSNAHVSPSAKIGKNVYIGAFAYVGENAIIDNNVKLYPQTFIGDNVQIGYNTTIYQGAKIYSDCIIGSNCNIHAQVVVGADGFGFAPSQGEFKKVAQIGNVIIEDYVEIGSNTCIDRATLGSTIIRKGVKLDNLIQIGHNAEIGENTVIAAQTGVAGSTKIGKNCMIGGQVGIVGHITIADEVKIAAQSGIGNSIEEKGAVVQGSPAFNIRDYKRTYVLFKQLPEFKEQLLKLEKLIKTSK